MKKSILHFSLDVAGTAVATIANITIGDDGEYECEADIGRSSGRTRFTIGVFCEFYALSCFAVTRRALSLHLNLTSLNRTKRTKNDFPVVVTFDTVVKLSFAFIDTNAKTNLIIWLTAERWRIQMEVRLPYVKFALYTWPGLVLNVGIDQLLQVTHICVQNDNRQKYNEHLKCLLFWNRSRKVSVE